MDRIEDLDLYVDAWTRTMIDIWQEKVSRLGIVRSGAFYNSFSGSVSSSLSGNTIALRFLMYGFYQALGVGPEFRHDNGGDLPFLGQEYREQHGLNRPRKVGPAWGGYKTSGNPRHPRDWYSRKLYASKKILVEASARILGENVAHVLCDELSGTRYYVW